MGRGTGGGSLAPPLGLEMRMAREANGWTLGEISEHLRIRPSYLEAIEDGRTADLPGSAYAVGFVRTYAKILGLDPDEAARRFRAEAGQAARRTELSFPAPVAERGVPALAVVAVGAVLVIGAYAAWYRLSGDQRPESEAVQVVPDRLTPLVAERPPATPLAPLPPAMSPSQPSQSAALQPQPSQSQPPQSQPPQSQPPQPAAAATANPPPVPEMPAVSPSQAAAAAPLPAAPVSRIVVRARADSWIQVKDARGQVLLNRVLRIGESWPVPPHLPTAGASPALLLTTGNAGGTELLVDGVAAASLGIDGSVRRDLPLDADAIRDGKLAANAVPPSHVAPRNQ